MRRVPKYQRSLERAGADVEVLLPGAVSPHVLDHLDGLLLIGGGDIDAKEFREENHPKVHHVDKNRDQMELNLTREALHRGIPVFGICRGVQVMNVALGGNLIQHIPDEIRTSIVHDDSESVRHNLVHEVSIRKDSRLHQIIGKDRVGVNSFHHQSIKDLGKGLIATAWSDDGVVEGIELPGPRYFLGVQWHPEEFIDHGAIFHELFESFVEACNNRGS
jgi:putative glutamine amidotransferase